MKNRILFVERLGVSNLYYMGVQIHSSRKICLTTRVQSRFGMAALAKEKFKFKNEEECEEGGYFII